MTNIDIRLQYQQETGDSLTTINNKATSSMDAKGYVAWLEERVIVLTRGIEAWEAANTISTAAHKAIHGSKNK